MLCVSAYIDFFASLIQQVPLGDERRVRARDPRRPRAIQVTTAAASQVPFPPLTSVLAVSWAHSGFSELQATSHTTPANSQGVATLSDVVPAVCCSSCVVCLG
jgi:hypothetical protein